MKKLLVLPLLLLSLIAYSAEYMPFPEAEISEEEWNMYYEEIKTKFGDTERTYPEQNLVTFSDSSTYMNFAFTTKGHPAHPSWITRQVVQENQNINMQQIGYFAGSEEAFAILFQQYAKLTEQTNQKFRLDGN